MTYEIFSQGLRKLTFVVSTEGLEVRRAWNQKKFWQWSKVIGAGIDSSQYVGVLKEIPSGLYVPGFKFLSSFNDQHYSGTRQFLIAYRGLFGSKNLEHLRIPELESSQTTRDFINDLKMKLGDKWVKEELDYDKMRRQLGFANWHIWIITIIFTILIFILMLGYWWLLQEWPSLLQN